MDEFIATDGSLKPGALAELPLWCRIRSAVEGALTVLACCLRDDVSNAGRAQLAQLVADIMRPPSPAHPIRDTLKKAAELRVRTAAGTGFNAPRSRFMMP